MTYLDNLLNIPKSVSNIFGNSQTSDTNISVITPTANLYNDGAKKILIAIAVAFTIYKIFK